MCLKSGDIGRNREGWKVCCPLVWIFSSAKSLNKIENLQKRALRFLYDDYMTIWLYNELLEKSGRPEMNLSRQRTLCIEIYKTLNDLNPSFMKNIFKERETNRLVPEKYKLNLTVPKSNQFTFWTKSLKSYGPKIWNSLYLIILNPRKVWQALRIL